MEFSRKETEHYTTLSLSTLTKLGSILNRTIIEILKTELFSNNLQLLKIFKAHSFDERK
jgi:hypothetical protein